VKIDIYSHIQPRKYLDALLKLVETHHKHLLTRFRVIESTRSLWDMGERFRVMDKYEGLVQVLVPTGPPVELLAKPGDVAGLVKLYNDEIAELVEKYPDRFIAGVACLPLNDVDAALEEARRAITELGFKGVLVDSPIYDYSAEKTKPIDLPEYMPLYEMMSDYDLPIWIHPRRESSMSDYTTEKESKYFINHCFGWPYETTVAMARLVFSGVLETYPTLKLITHHAGAMVPFFADRIVKLYGYQGFHAQTAFMEKLKKPPIDYFKAFYNDTALYGSPAGLMCAYAFFGGDRLLFGTDMPYDAEQGDQYTRETIHAIEQMHITGLEKEKIFKDNAMALLHLSTAKSKQ
jgi:predicted TIM-barrel fold metal-dependent hydrolase